MAPLDKSLIKALKDARLEKRQIDHIDVQWRLPSEEEAYDTMFAVIAQLPWTQAGWKIAATNCQMQAQLRTNTPVFGPTFCEHFVHSPAQVMHDGLLSPIVECEFFFTLGKSLPARGRPYTFDDVVSAIDRVHVGIEIAECRFLESKLPSKEFIIADGFASGRYVVGPQLTAWKEAFERDIDVFLFKNGKQKAHGSSSDVMGHPLAPVVWLTNELNAMGRQLSEGQVVSSGTCNILARARKGDVFKAIYDGVLEIEVAFL
jgi:2-keto-4-pentenoate hydratase